MSIDSSDIGRRLVAVRAAAPLVQCITNAVAMNLSANALLAVGATPAMVDIPDEAAPFAQAASALLTNVGTPYAEQRQAMVEATRAAVESDKPRVLDPVAVGSLPVRTDLATRLLAQNPTAIRGNPSEIIALAGAGAGGRGVDAVDSPDDALSAAHALAREHHSIVAVSGPTDVITDGKTAIRLSNGDAWLTRVTGAGCALGALIAAFLAAEETSALHAVAAASAAYTIAAEVAAERARGPGSFAAGLLDALSTLDEPTIDARLVAA